jgi:hypothetical protein
MAHIVIDLASSSHSSDERLVVPTSAELDRAERTVANMKRRSFANNEENRTLAFFGYDPLAGVSVASEARGYALKREADALRERRPPPRDPTDDDDRLRQREIEHERRERKRMNDRLRRQRIKREKEAQKAPARRKRARDNDSDDGYGTRQRSKKPRK